MSKQYGCIAFTDTVDAEQQAYGSAEFYRRMTSRGHGLIAGDPLGAREQAFFATRDSFYLATVSETGWPYVQFRGGPPGFVRADEHTLSWADYRGNLQHVSTGNIRADERVSIIAMDYPSRSRLKLFGRAHVVRVEDDEGFVEGLRHPDETDAVVERAIVITVSAFDWNCPQHITPRYTASEIENISGHKAE
ncbi:pyridoxamine 5'-phosphate oxidase family protein [Lacisediminihabitans changchengi]|uniref:Pyridoxamine 5'-phosphate oxidase family protein n=1 Tax=Lacisediminihabitans changchengi TaxID=2787634 RepID=A0A934SJ38_9MICO|nr:pyridoxamine 5'-phosphate oxidase family protein [Lacisediminihabitans changchengi]MBK4346528.1 pyridoxamine 5'-phosphate oxidase family protein [Lacisediminihabitans changchengi]